MFILRTIHKEGGSVNQSIGGCYFLVHKNVDKEAFESYLGGSNQYPDSQKIHGFLVYDEKEPYPLYKGVHYYIMTESGKTFENITCK